MKRYWTLRQFGGTIFAEGWQLVKGEEVTVVDVDEFLEVIQKLSDLQDKLFETKDALHALQMEKLKK